MLNVLPQAAAFKSIFKHLSRRQDELAFFILSLYSINDSSLFGLLTFGLYDAVS